MSRLRTHMQDATSRLGMGTILAHGTSGADFRRKDDFHACSCLTEASTRLSLGAGRLLRGPIDGKMRQIEALAGFGLPTTVRHGGTDQLDSSLSAAGKQIGIDIACIRNLLLRLERCFDQLLLND